MVAMFEQIQIINRIIEILMGGYLGSCFITETVSKVSVFIYRYKNP